MNRWWLLVGALLLGCQATELSPTPTLPPPTPVPTMTSPATLPSPAPSVTPEGLSLSNDFEAPTGRAPDARPESPGEFRLLVALSQDGITFEPTGQLVLDQANVPDLILDDEGLIRLYFTTARVGGRPNAMALAISPDLGQSWYFKALSFEGLASDQPPPADPDIVRLADGRFRLFGTTQLDGGRLGIVSMDSEDGIHFGPPQVALALESNIIDSTTFEFQGRWHMLVLDGKKPEQWYATSTDGRTFTVVEKRFFEADGHNYLMSNGFPRDGAYRLFGFSIPQGDFRAFDSSDGQQWVPQPEIPLAFPASTLEGQLIKDPALLPLPDGRTLMVYVTKIP